MADIFLFSPVSIISGYNFCEFDIEFMMLDTFYSGNHNRFVLMRVDLLRRVRP